MKQHHDNVTIFLQKFASKNPGLNSPIYSNIQGI